MTILTDSGLEFSKRHIQRFYDTDFFPKPFEFEAIWHCWEDVKKDLTSRNVGKIAITPPRIMAWPKVRGGYRLVHQLEPVDSIIYAALVSSIAEAIEKKRPDRSLGVACSYRIELNDGSLFSSGTGFDQYRESCTKQSQLAKCVLKTDISDFYNQISIHRLNNAIEQADSRLSDIAEDIESFLSRLNVKTSQGIPVGPAASIVLAEAAMIDVDQFLENKGVNHARYVDDFRVFGESKEHLEWVLQELSLYIHENHRLSLATDKTSIVSVSEFVDEELKNQYQMERMEILESVEVLNPYTHEVEQREVLAETAPKAIAEALTKLMGYETLDLGISRAVIRTAKAYEIEEPIPLLLENIHFFSPVCNDIFLYFDEVWSDEHSTDYVGLFEGMLTPIPPSSMAVRYWLAWFFSSRKELLKNQKIRNFVFNQKDLAIQAQAAITTDNLAWVREKKTSLHYMGSWDRRAVIYASQILAKDERDNWLKLVQANALTPIEKWVAQWILDGGYHKYQNIFGDDILF